MVMYSDARLTEVTDAGPAAVPAARRATVGVRELRADLAAAVRRAAAGERTLVSVNGQPVAQLGPVEPSRISVTLDDLISLGLLEPARRSDAPRPSRPVPVWSAARLDRLLAEVRGR